MGLFVQVKVCAITDNTEGLPASCQHNLADIVWLMTQSHAHNNVCTYLGGFAQGLTRGVAKPFY